MGNELYECFITSTVVVIGLTPTTYAVNESNGDIALLEVCAEINVGVLERNVTVTLTSMDGSATSTGIIVSNNLLFRELYSKSSTFFVPADPQDFQSVNTQLMFTSGQETGGMQCTNLQVLDDSILEDEETLTLHLVADATSVVGITASADSAVVTIGEDPTDGKGSASL